MEERKPIWYWKKTKKFYFSEDEILCEIGSYEGYNEAIENGDIEVSSYTGIIFLPVREDDEFVKSGIRRDED